MRGFDYARAADARDAIEAAAQSGIVFVAGGTDLLQLLQEDILAPAGIVDLSRLPLDGVRLDGQALRIGALTRLADVADHPDVQRRAPLVAMALAETASPQVRNMATIGGNLLQRTRCPYFRDAASPCNRRAPGSGCPAQDGRNRMTAILGGSEHCIAAYPGDLAVALAALDATVEIEGTQGSRSLPIFALHRRPGDRPDQETALQPGDLITAVHVPDATGARSAYVKLRDRASFEWALASAAVLLEQEGDTVRHARIAVGGVATVPWRLPRVEQALAGRRLDEVAIDAAAALATVGAQPRGDNAFKMKLLPAVVAQALRRAGGLA